MPLRTVISHREYTTKYKLRQRYYVRAVRHGAGFRASERGACLRSWRSGRIGASGNLLRQMLEGKIANLLFEQVVFGDLRCFPQALKRIYARSFESCHGL